MQRVTVKRGLYDAHKKQRSNMVFIMAGLIFVSILGGFLLGSKVSGGGSNTETVTIRPRTSPVGEHFSSAGPKSREGIVPTGYEKSIYGAITAASAYSGSLPSLYPLRDGYFAQAMSTMASSSARETLAQRFSIARSAYIQSTNSGKTFYRELPIGYSVISSSDDEVQIELWNLSVMTSAIVGRGLVSGTIQVITLVWEDDDWKVSDWFNKPGPTPEWVSQDDPVTTEEFVQTAAIYSGGYDYVPNK